MRQMLGAAAASALLAGGLLGLAACGRGADEAPALPWNSKPPGPGTPFQIQLDGGVPADDGAAIVIVDGSVSADAVARLHATGAYVICYLSVGTSEEWRPDAGAFPESVLGEPLPDWPDERYVDLRALDALAPIWSARLDECAVKGFDAIDPDNIDSYANASGFPLTEDDAVAAWEWLAREAHARGMGIGQKNAPSLTPRFVGLADFAVTEECLDQGWCGEMRAFVAGGKPVLAIEYVEDGASLERWCAPADGAGLSLLVTTLELPGTGARCGAA